MVAPYTLIVSEARFLAVLASAPDVAPPGSVHVAVEYETLDEARAEADKLNEAMHVITLDAPYDWATMLAASVPEGWRPIETAPKDGSKVMLYLGAPWSCTDIARWFSPWENWERGDELPDTKVDEYCGIGSAVPTHWMPLPAAPSIIATKEPK